MDNIKLKERLATIYSYLNKISFTGLDNGSMVFADNPDFTLAVSLMLEDGHLRFYSENKKLVNLNINLSSGVNIIGSP